MATLRLAWAILGDAVRLFFIPLVLMLILEAVQQDIFAAIHRLPVPAETAAPLSLNTLSAIYVALDTLFVALVLRHLFDPAQSRIWPDRRIVTCALAALPFGLAWAWIAAGTQASAFELLYGGPDVSLAEREAAQEDPWRMLAYVIVNSQFLIWLPLGLLLVPTAGAMLALPSNASAQGGRAVLPGLALAATLATLIVVVTFAAHGLTVLPLLPALVYTAIWYVLVWAGLVILAAAIAVQIRKRMLQIT